MIYRVLRMFELPWFLIFASIAIVGFPLGTLILSCLGVETKRHWDWGDEMELAFASGVFTLGAVLIGVGLYLASPWTLGCGVVLAGYFPVVSGVGLAWRWLRQRQATPIDPGTIPE